MNLKDRLIEHISTDNGVYCINSRDDKIRSIICVDLREYKYPLPEGIEEMYEVNINDYNFEFPNSLRKLMHMKLEGYKFNISKNVEFDAVCKIGHRPS